MFEFNN